MKQKKKMRIANLAQKNNTNVWNEYFMFYDLSRIHHGTQFVSGSG